MSRDWTARHFTRSEFECQCGCGRADMDPAFIQILDRLRGMLGFPLIVSSGFRCPEHNARVSSTGRTGPHTTGKAVDLAVSHGEAAMVLLTAGKAVYDGIGITGIASRQKGAGRFVHLDCLRNGENGAKRPMTWGY